MVREIFKKFDRLSEIVKPITPPVHGLKHLVEQKQHERAMHEQRYKQQLAHWKEQQREDARLNAIQDPTQNSIQVNRYCNLEMSHRLAVIGMSGSGKTTFARQLIPRMRAWFHVPVIIFDTKGQGEFDDIATTLSIDQRAPEFPSDNGVFVWKPPLDMLEEYDLFLERILKARRPCFVVIDELANFGRGNPDSYVPNYALLLKQGRGLNICTLSMVQEYAAIPRQTVGQTSHLFRFHLLNDYDRLRLNRMLGLSKMQQDLEPPVPFGFFYRRVDKPGPVYSYNNWQEFFNAYT